ncbi:MAG TPA: ketopantoate reductase C-terminal domain-containing protein, partial [Burkholderiaceae bacterium]|nr:ketopantoate reductase C-terminal domain-containing protein [Burkholderiaceae bacterium]
LDGKNDAVVERCRAVLNKAVPTATTGNIVGARWTKLIVNLNNVLPALCNLSFKHVYRDRFLRRLALSLMREGIAVAERAGVRLESLPGTSLPLVRLVATLPAMLAGVVAARKAAQLETHWPLKGSTWQSVERGQPTEIEYLNGEIVRQGKELGVPTPLNERAVALAQRVATERRYLTAHEVEQAFAGTDMSRVRAAAGNAGG